MDTAISVKPLSAPHQHTGLILWQRAGEFVCARGDYAHPFHMRSYKTKVDEEAVADAGTQDGCDHTYWSSKYARIVSMF
jgi:hypothetical protein